MRLLADLEAILLIDIPRYLRLALVVIALLLSHALGLAWLYAAEYERASVKAEMIGEITELRNQVRHLWKVYEATRKRMDRTELVWRESREG